jgi:hypothetical protein
MNLHQNVKIWSDILLIAKAMGSMKILLFSFDNGHSQKVDTF